MSNLNHRMRLAQDDPVPRKAARDDSMPFRWWVEEPKLNGEIVRVFVRCNYVSPTLTSAHMKTERFGFEFGRKELENFVPEDIRDNAFALPRALGKVSRQIDQVRSDLAKVMADEVSKHPGDGAIAQILKRDLIEEPTYGYRMRLMAKNAGILKVYRQPVALGGRDRY